MATIFKDVYVDMPFTHAHVDLLDACRCVPSKVNGIQVYCAVPRPAMLLLSLQCTLCTMCGVAAYSDHSTSVTYEIPFELGYAVLEGSCLCQLTRFLPISASFSTRLFNSFLTSLPFSPHHPFFHFLLPNISSVKQLSMGDCSAAPAGTEG